MCILGCRLKPTSRRLESEFGAKHGNRDNWITERITTRKNQEQDCWKHSKKLYLAQGKSGESMRIAHNPLCDSSFSNTSSSTCIESTSEKHDQHPCIQRSSGKASSHRPGILRDSEQTLFARVRCLNSTLRPIVERRTTDDRSRLETYIVGHRLGNGVVTQRRRTGSGSHYVQGCSRREFLWDIL